MTVRGLISGMIPLDKADKLAAKILAALAPYCDQIEIAGSIRRRRPLVGDIDIVCLPKAGDYQTLRERVLVHSRVITEGPQTIITRLQNGVQLDLWIARQPTKDLLSETPTNFGMLFLARTGSTQHNIWLCQVAERMGRHFNPNHGIYEGRRLVASATEEDIFKALQMDFVPPEQRERT